MRLKRKVKVFDEILYQLITSLKDECKDCRVILDCTCNDIKKACDCIIKGDDTSQADKESNLKIVS